jgi:hypothetical protein
MHMRRKRRSNIEKIRGLSELERLLLEGGHGFTVKAVNSEVTGVEDVINGRNEAIHYSKFITLRDKEQNKRGKSVHIDLDYTLNAETNTLYRGFGVFPKSRPFVERSTSGKRYTIAGGLSRNKGLLDKLLENEGFYSKAAGVIYDAIVSKVTDDLGLQNRNASEIAIDLVRMAFNKQFDMPYKPNGRFGFSNGDFNNQVQKLQNKPLSQYLKDTRKNITLYITLDYKHMGDIDKQSLVKMGMLPLETYQSGVQKSLGIYLRPFNSLTPKK